MEDIVALLAREAGKKMVEAQNNARVEAAKRKAAVDAAKRQAANTWGTPSGRPGGGPSSAGRTAAPAATPVAAVPIAPPSRPPAPPRIEPIAIETFELPGFAAEPAHPSVALLAAFSGGGSLLAGIVLSEALAPPISLRGPQLFDRLER